jgi:hypothetical protein
MRHAPGDAYEYKAEIVSVRQKKQKLSSDTK